MPRICYHLDMATTTAKKMTKTAVETLKARINARLDAPGGTREGRQELASLLEAYLMEARCYRGYAYLDTNPEAMKEYHAFLDRTREGVTCDEAYEAEYKRVYLAAFGDDSRRVYY